MQLRFNKRKDHEGKSLSWSFFLKYCNKCSKIANSGDEMERKQVRYRAKQTNKKQSLKKRYEIKTIIKEYLEFYQEKLKKTHIICFIICLILFFILLGSKMTQVDQLFSDGVAEKIVDVSYFSSLIKNKIPIIFVIILAGITPFVHLSALGFIVPYHLVMNICASYAIHHSVVGVIFMCVGAIIQLFAFSLAIATGFYYCKLTSKKYRYQQHSSLGIRDVKAAVYKLRKQDEKLEKLTQKEYEKSVKREELNVKIPYRFFAVSFVICSIILVLGTLLLK